VEQLRSGEAEYDRLRSALMELHGRCTFRAAGRVTMVSARKELDRLQRKREHAMKRVGEDPEVIERSKREFIEAEQAFFDASSQLDSVKELVSSMQSANLKRFKETNLKIRTCSKTWR